MADAIEIKHVTKDYGGGRGVFDVSFSVRSGEIMGFLGPNGAGKTTTIRQLLGFIHPDSGSLYIQGLDCFREAAAIAGQMGYLPGELALLDNMTGSAFLQFMAKMKRLPSLKRAEQLSRIFELDPRGKIRRMSKGTKQKLGIVNALMGDPKLLILDEPTSGLDPLMQNRFIEQILEQKKRGATVLMSSHLFEEVERTCDRAVIIRKGRVAAIKEMDDLRSSRRNVFALRFAQQQDAAAFANAMPGAVQNGRGVTVEVVGEADRLIKTAAAYHVENLEQQRQTLEQLFLHLYGEAE